MDLTVIKGISDKRKSDYASMGVYDTLDLVKHFPRAYLDLTKVKPLGECINNQYVLTTGRVINVLKTFASTARKIKYVKIVCEQNGIPFTVIWFNQPYVLKKLRTNEEYLFYGRVKNEYGQATLTNPDFEPIDANYKLKGIVPQYSLSGGLTQRIVRENIAVALRAENIKDAIPYELQKKYMLAPLSSAYREVHNPSTMTLAREAQERIALEEYFVLICAFRLIKGDSEQVRVNKYSVSENDVRSFISSFEYSFTNGQISAVNDVYNDLKGATVMNRLIEGDVGCGKTAVALTGLYMAVKSGYQAVMLAPTEVLAEQNYNIIRKYLKDFNIELLTGSRTASEKKDIKQRLKSGEIQILSATHAVLQKDVEFNNLAFAVCDEQHRFGVSQRSKLLSKGNDVCDLLVMSATPIPRTVSLIFYGDLDVSVIKEKPKQRTAVLTRIVPAYKYDGMLSYIESEAKIGHQTYFVCPKIEEDEEGTVMSVTELYDGLKAKLPHLKIALLHGKMKDKEKNAVMTAFKNKEYDCLVSTTVIEVGIDVADATVMVIYDADRFGLSQLHQLRGRVGRSDLQSYCFLLTNSESEKSLERLKVFVDCDNGFDIADKDYEMRGSGDFLGERQSGKFFGEVGNLCYGVETVLLAKKLCDEAFASGKIDSSVRETAYKKYEKLQNISLN